MKSAFAFALTSCCASVASAALNASANITAQQIGPTDWHYTITLDDTGSTNVGTFWLSWVPGQGYLPTLPTNFVNPTGWSSILTDGTPPANGYSIQWKTSTNPLTASGALAGFAFDSADSPATLEANSTIHAGVPVLTSTVYSAGPFSDGGQALVAQIVPEPASVGLLMAAGLLLRRKRRNLTFHRRPESFQARSFRCLGDGDKLGAMKPTTLILRTAGTNCDEETAHAFELAGARAERVHINCVLEEPGLLSRYQILAIPGGFSYGDDIAAGRILANQIAHHLHDELHRFVESGRPVIGICNGFQVLVKTDLLPGPVAGHIGQTATLTHNDNGRFVDRWVALASRSRKCIWTSGVDDLELPVAHGEGKFVPGDPTVRRGLFDQDQVALVYIADDGAPAGGRFPDNPNGSIDDIAGICDASGLVLGLMPHPERFVDATQHPAWTRRPVRVSEGAGLRIFRNAVAQVIESASLGI